LFRLTSLYVLVMTGKVFDKLDIDLLKQLLEDSRQTSKDLALKLQAHKDTVRKRIGSLVSRGVVDRFTITINQAKLAEMYPSIWSVIFSVAVLRDRNDLVKELLDHPNVVEVDEANPAAIHDLIVFTQFGNVDEFDEFAHYLKSKPNIDPTKLDVTPVYKQHRRRDRIINAITNSRKEA
jgi:Lrp/AsnC family transcriptional regulator, leucine-responsive regulatory protein